MVLVEVVEVFVNALEVELVEVETLVEVLKVELVIFELDREVKIELLELPGQLFWHPAPQ